MQVPSKRTCRKAVNKLLKNHGVKVVNHRKWYNKKKKQYAKTILLEAGLVAMADRLENTALYIEWGKKKLILTPGNMWKGSLSKTRRVHKLALFAHEMTHSEQAERTSLFFAKYVLNSDKRAAWEVDACAAGADIYRVMDSPQRFIDAEDVFDADWKKMYYLDDKQVAFAKAKYNRRLQAHQRDQLASTVGSELVALLKKG